MVQVLPQDDVSRAVPDHPIMLNIHIILHQFDLIERLLGPPADLRVTDKVGVYSGLLRDDRARALLGAVTNGNRSENDWCWTQVDDNGLPKALSSLRETIKNIQVSLDL